MHFAVSQITIPALGICAPLTIHHGFFRCSAIRILLMSWVVLRSRADTSNSISCSPDTAMPSIPPLPVVSSHTQSPSPTLSTLVVASVTEPLSAQLLLPTPSLASAQWHIPRMTTHVHDNNITITPIVTVRPTLSPKIYNLNSSSQSTFSMTGSPGWGFGNSAYGRLSCQLDYSYFLSSSSEADKWASGVATTLMTILPSLIAFGPLKTADTQTLYYLDALVALVTCGFTLLFRVDTWTTLPKDKIWRVTDILDKVDINAIYYRTRYNRLTPPRSRMASPYRNPQAQPRMLLVQVLRFYQIEAVYLHYRPRV
ncbi:hypothetical protein HOY80DRAFT_483877 [Tuber brumale]|nr:hypothetical protein HOY80DRAFT_483877 [Tuber brumale]